MATYTIGLAEAKKHFSKITAEVNRTGKSVTVLKNNRPWVIIHPAACSPTDGEGSDVAVDLLESIEYSVARLSDPDNE